jgi:hypothetical protein
LALASALEKALQLARKLDPSKARQLGHELNLEIDLESARLFDLEMGRASAHKTARQKARLIARQMARSLHHSILHF